MSDLCLYHISSVSGLPSRREPEDREEQLETTLKRLFPACMLPERRVSDSTRISSQAFGVTAAFTGYSLGIDKSNTLVNSIKISCEMLKGRQRLLVQF